MQYEKLPADWKVTCLDELVEPESSITYGVVQPGENDSKGVLFVRGGDFPNGEILVDQLRKIPKSISDSYRRTHLRGGELLISLVGQPGTCAVVPPELKGANIARQVALLRLLPNNEARYLKAFLSTSRGQSELLRNTLGSVQQVINLRDLGTARVTLPTLSEQQKIVAVLEAIDSTIAHTSTLIAKLKQMKAGLLHDLLTRGLDENGKLRDAIEHPEKFKDSPLGQIPKDWQFLQLSSLLNGRPKNGYSPKEVNEWSGTLMLGLGCLTEEGFKPHQLKNAPLRDPRISSALLSDGDFLVSRSNTRKLVALCGIYREIGVPCIYSDLMMRLTPNEKTTNRFLELLLQHPPTRKQLTGKAQGTSGSMVKISSQTVLDAIVALPERIEQAEIIKSIDKYDDRIRSEEAYLSKLKEQKKGLMHDLLAGRVRVTDLKEIPA
jgi:type I restriction enzyme S subunit